MLVKPRKESRVRLLVCALVWIAMAGSAAWAATASGKVTVGGNALEAADALAWQQRDTFGSGGQATIVLLAGGPIDRKGLDTALDFETALGEVKEAAGTWVELEFASDGNWQAVRYQFRQGGSFSSGMKGFGASERPKKASVAVAGGNVRGTLKVAPADHPSGDGPALALTLDVPLLKRAAGTPLPADGGEPGQAVRACVTAFRAKEEAGLRKHCAELTYWLDVYKRQGDDMNEFWSPSRFGTCSVFSFTEVGVTGGRTLGEQAEVLVAGKSEEQDCTGSVYLKRDGGAWKVTAARAN